MFSIVPLLFIGRLPNPKPLMAAAALAQLYMNCTGFALIYGVASGKGKPPPLFFNLPPILYQPL